MQVVREGYRAHVGAAGWGLQWTGAGAGGWGELGPELSVCADPNRSGAVLLFIPRGCWDMCVFRDCI